MKRVLIAGAGSYIGTHLKAELTADSKKFLADELDVKQPWNDDIFSGYDCVVIVAGIAHQRESKQNREDYFRVNRDLAVRIANSAKNSGVSQLVYLSSMAVYGLTEGMITSQTPVSPTTAYGQSKLQAEEKLLPLRDERFSVAILRPPMVYGRNCPGNYRVLSRLSRKLPAFPDFKNQRSMIHIDTLTDFLRQLIESGRSGLFFPQESEYISTAKMMREIAAANGKKLLLIRGLSWCVALARRLFPLAQKAFGTLIYTQEMSGAFPCTRSHTLQDTIRDSEAPA